MQSDLPSKKRIGFVELPDEALDLFGHYAKRPNWEVAVVVSTHAQSYAARMGELLGLPVLERPDATALGSCDRIVVGNTAGLMAMVNDLVDTARTEVLPLGEAIREMGKGSPPKAKAPAPGGHDVPAADSTAGSSWQEYTSDSSFDTGTLLGADLREKLGALPIDTGSDRLLHEILEMAIRMTHADSGSIMLVDEFGTLRVAVADGLPQWVIAHARQEVGKGISGQVFATGKPRLLHGHLSSSQSGSVDVRPGLREAACVPIPTKDGPIGVLNVSVESEERKLDEASIALLNLFAREASAAVLKALNLQRLPGNTQREAVIRQVERLMALQEPLAGRLRVVGEALAHALGAQSVQCHVVDADGTHLELQAGSKNPSAVPGQQSLDRGFVPWILRHNSPHVLSATCGDEEMGVAYLPIVSSRPEGVLTLECIPLTGTESVQVLTLLTEVKETVEAQIALEASTGEFNEEGPDTLAASA
jgi:hypothetical protein